MMTGYVGYMVENNQTFEEFALTCARNFGALIMMRDESWNAPIPIFEPTDHYTKRLAESKEELARLLAMSNDEKWAYGKAIRDRNIADGREWLEAAQRKEATIDAMLEQVQAWEPPTADHVNLKEFMIEQLMTSKEDNVKWRTESLATTISITPMEYYDAAVESAERSIARHAEMEREEIERTNKRNAWVRELRESLRSMEAITDNQGDQ